MDKKLILNGIMKTNVAEISFFAKRKTLQELKTYQTNLYLQIPKNYWNNGWEIFKCHLKKVTTEKKQDMYRLSNILKQWKLMSATIETKRQRLLTDTLLLQHNCVCNHRHIQIPEM